jgi:hypothetical protein
MRAGKKDEHLTGWLGAIVMQAKSGAWHDWAERRLAGISH